MKKKLHVDDVLFREAKEACGAITDTETVWLGLVALVRRAAYERLRALLGTEPQAQNVPRGLHLLASSIVGRFKLWTLDPRLAMLAKELGVAYETPA